MGAYFFRGQRERIQAATASQADPARRDVARWNSNRSHAGFSNCRQRGTNLDTATARDGADNCHRRIFSREVPPTVAVPLSSKAISGL